MVSLDDCHQGTEKPLEDAHQGSTFPLDDSHRGGCDVAP